MQRALLICTVATLGIATALTASVMPAFPAAPADSGSVVGTVTALGGGACLELTNTTVNFGTLPFSTRTQLSSAQGSLTPTFKNCGNFNENISISGSDATGVNPAWQLGSKFAGNPCTDANGTALVNFYGLSFDAPPVGRVSITKTATSISTYGPGATTPLALQLDMPCVGSSGDGQTVSFSVNLTAAIA